MKFAVGNCNYTIIMFWSRFTESQNNNTKILHNKTAWFTNCQHIIVMCSRYNFHNITKLPPAVRKFEYFRIHVRPSRPYARLTSQSRNGSIHAFPSRKQKSDVFDVYLYYKLYSFIAMAVLCASWLSRVRDNRYNAIFMVHRFRVLCTHLKRYAWKHFIAWNCYNFFY